LIVPSNRLLAFSGAVFVPFAVAAAFLPAALAAGLTLSALFLFGVLLDVLLSARLLSQIDISSSPVVRLSKGAKGEIELHVKSPARRFKAVRFGLPFPESISPEREDFHMELPGKEGLYYLKWKVLASVCGRYSLNGCGVETGSVMGFWLVRRVVPLETELRVYPDLRSERRSAAALFLNRGDYGGHLWRQVSKGREFEKLREYIPGDTFQDIHWKTTAKRRHPVTKIYQIERTQEIYVILDSSRLSARRVRFPESEEPVTLLERYIRSALMLAAAAGAQGDLFGLIEFGSKPNLFLKASGGKTHFNTCRNSLYTLLPEDSSPDFAALVSFIQTRLRKRALLVFLTSLDDAAEAERFKESVSLLSRHHLALVNMLAPEGARPLFSGEKVRSVSELYEHLSGHISWRKLYELGLHLKTKGVQFSLLENEHLSADLVTQYMRIKQKQLI